MLIDRKTTSYWPLRFNLQCTLSKQGRWLSKSWQVTQLTLYQDQTTTELGRYLCQRSLNLCRAERSDYRFNLSSQSPHLFFVCEEDPESQLKPLLITASQIVAAGYMDGDYQVLHIAMPLAVQAWIEAYLGREGELIEVKKRRYHANADNKQPNSGNSHCGGRSNGN